MPPDQDPWDRTRLVHQGPSVLKVAHCGPPKSSPTARHRRSLSLHLSISTEQVVLFLQSPSYFSQWSPSSFIVDDVSYSCAEQFMTVEKARLFQNRRAEELIMSSPDPRAHKHIDWSRHA